MKLDELKEILRLIDEKEIAEFELEEEGIKLRIRKAPHASNHGAAGQGVDPVSAAVPAPVALPPQAIVASAAPAPGPAAGSPAADEEAGLIIVKSPMVGTFYRAPDPNSPPFVNVGDRVRVGQAVCIIEAMKLMNEIEAEVAGEVARIYHENGQPVQYGEPLFAVRP